MNKWNYFMFQKNFNLMERKFKVFVFTFQHISLFPNIRLGTACFKNVCFYSIFNVEILFAVTTALLCDK